MTLESLTPLIQWITLHPTWSGFIVFIISLTESLAVVGLVVPGVILMTAIGSLIGAGRLPGLETMGWAVLGAVAGDGLSYWLGHHYRHKLKYIWPFTKFPNWLERGTIFFKVHGGKSIILGRFVGPVRPTIPVIAGIMGMKAKTFLFFNIVSAIAWAPIYCLPGILIGASLGQLSPKTASTLLSLVLGLLFILWLIFYLLLKIILSIKNSLTNLFKKMWLAWQQSKKLPWLQQALITAKDPNKGQLGTVFIFLMALIGFVIIIVSVITESGIVHLNDPIYQCFRSLYSRKIADWSIIIISLGEPWILLTVSLIVSFLALYKSRPAALYWLGISIVGFAIGQYCKLFIYSLRPEGLVQPPNTYSFPSNHVLLATLIYGVLAMLAKDAVSQTYRWLVWVSLFAIIGLISLSGMYLGLHWFTDMLGGITLGTACVAFGILLYRRFVHVTNIPLRRLFLMIFVVVFIIFATIYNLYTYQNNKENWQRQWPAQILEVNKWWAANPVAEALYRAGVLERNILPFDFNWLGEVTFIAHTLANDGWHLLPQLNLETSLMLLAEKPSAQLIPVFPRFHRDRLPSLVMAKFLPDSSKRIVLQLWASDYITMGGLTLWVGTIRLEKIEKRIPFLTFYLEISKASKNQEIMQQFIATIKDDWQYKKMLLSSHSLLLIAPKQNMH